MLHRDRDAKRQRAMRKSVDRLANPRRQKRIDAAYWCALGLVVLGMLRALVKLVRL